MNFQLKSLFLAGVVVAGPLFGATQTRAATVDAGAFGGWRFGGSFHDAEGESHTAEPSGSWGGTLDIYFNPGSALEVLFSRQETSVNSGGAAQVTFTLDHYQIGGLKEYEGERFRPFLAGLLGWSHVKTENLSNDLFSVTLGGGAKYFLTPRLGLRGDLRAHLIFGNNYAVSASGGSSGGSVSFAGEVFAQGEVAGGLFLTFGGPREESDAARPLDDYRHRESIPFD